MPAEQRLNAADPLLHCMVGVNSGIAFPVWIVRVQDLGSARVKKAEIVTGEKTFG